MATGTSSVSIEEIRAADRARKAKARKAASSLEIPDPKDPQRRERAEADPELFLRTYLGKTFTRPFTRQQREIIAAIMTAAKYGGYQAIAASRGEGKTVLAQAVALVYGILTGLVHFPLIVAATGPHAERILGNVKRIYARNQLLCEDYPEVCVPIWDLRSAPQKGLSQHVNGEPTFAQWSGEQVVMPTVRGSKASGAMIATKGLDAALRGIVIDDCRPDLILIDDPETRESSRSAQQCELRELIIEEDLAGLGSQDKPMAMLMLTTIQNMDCLSARYTDPKQKPAWKGRRFRLVEKWPDRMDLWDNYVMQRQADHQAEDEHARKAHAYYLENREAMDAGAEVANPHRFKPIILPDGSRLEESALQACFNIIADRSRDHFDTEYQNDPPVELAIDDGGLSAYHVQKQLSGYEWKAIPPGCTTLTQGIDVRKRALHCVVRAWRPDGTGYTIDYGIEEVTGTIAGSDEGVDKAIINAICNRMEAVRDSTYATLDGEILPVGMTLVDAGWRTEAVYHACRTLMQTVRTPDIRPAMGFGKSMGCVKVRWSGPLEATTDKKPGNRWFLSRQPNGIWLCCMDADHWKNYEHDRWLTATDKPGTMFLWGVPSNNPDRWSDDEKRHFSYAKHIVAEAEKAEIVKGVEIRRFKAKSDTNHYLDASYMSCVAADMQGIRLLRAPEPKSAPVVSMKQLRAMAKRGK